MQHQSGLERARLALERGQRLPGGVLAPLVAQSWQRCRDLGLDPRMQPREAVIPFADVKRKREANTALRRLALAEMQMLHAQIAGSNFMIALADHEGVVLDTISDQRFADSAAGRAIIPGSLWDEALRGTNGLGLAALERKPVAVYGREHYFGHHGHLSCMAAPIFDSSGRVIGLLDASCSYEARQEHTMALVRMAALQIENGLIYHQRGNTFIFAFHPRVEYLDTLSAGLISVSNDGRVSAINRPATSLLAGLAACVGSAFDSLFETGVSAAIDGMMSGSVIRIRDQAGSGVFMVCRQIGQSDAVSGQSRVPASSDAMPGPQADFVCDDAAVGRNMREIGEAVSLRMPVYIYGKTGTGKELMARHVHKVAGRNGEFVAVNCGAVPESLFIAEIFGYARGAFTDARAEGSRGLARAADGGTLFFDEVADIPAGAQTALLRFLDTMEVRAIGEPKTHKVDVQIVSASNADLGLMVSERRFRADLFYRLNSFTIKLPPLAARSDFAAIVHHLIGEMAPGIAITDAAIASLARRPWPGNIRELRSVLQRALMRRQMGHIDEGALDEAVDADFCNACRGHPLSERRCSEIRTIYRSSAGNVSETARRLGLSRTTVYKHICESISQSDHNRF